ncbi:hypothetical protein QC763_122400 [Podospora pseudopauciseta]|uniref:Protein kinase domain-containing protein n=1 Tax=Podospora pseudopauciseta TaxID=2093780 RepID=A0ABR0I3Z2_9PEZI|nr:hypothetical protein QC763_122400 [Podospora pseudopauciseta]
MIPKHRRFVFEHDEWDDTHYSCVFFDQERRQYMQLQFATEAVPKIPDNHVRRIESEKKFYEYARIWLPAICDKLAPAHQTFVADTDGNLVSSGKSTIPIQPSYVDRKHEAVKPTEPGFRGFVYRNKLLELIRRPGQVDRVAYISTVGEKGGPIKEGRVVEADFRYYCTKDAKTISHCLRNLYFLNRILTIPNDQILGRFHHAVLEKKSVVGYLTQAARGPNINTFSTADKKRPFKLAHLEKLLDGVKTLNLVYGLVSKDLQANDIVIDEDTDELWFRSFSHCVPISSQNAMFDVALAYILLYEKITHNIQTPPKTLAEARDLVKKLSAIDTWFKSDAAELDADVTKYRRVMNNFLQSSYLDVLFEKSQHPKPQTGIGSSEVATEGRGNASLGNQTRLSRKRPNEGSPEDSRPSKRNKTNQDAPDVDVNWEEAKVPKIPLSIIIPDEFTIKVGGVEVNITSEKLWRRGKSEGTQDNPIIDWYRPATDSPARKGIKYLLANGKAAPENDRAGRWHELLIQQPTEEDEELDDWDPFALSGDVDDEIRQLCVNAAQVIASAKQRAANAREATLKAKTQARLAGVQVQEIRKAIENAQALVADYVAGNATRLTI